MITRISHYHPSLQVLPECVYSVVLDGLVGLEQMGEGDRLDDHTDSTLSSRLLDKNLCGNLASTLPSA